MTLGGSLIDTPDIQGILNAIASTDWGDDEDSDVPDVMRLPVDVGEELVAAYGPGLNLVER
jgi:hypothetical protein